MLYNITKDNYLFNWILYFWGVGYNGWRYGLVKADHYRPIKDKNFKQPLLTIPLVSVSFLSVGGAKKLNKMKWINEIQELVAEGLMKNLNYNRLAISKDNFLKTNIRQINCFGITVDIIQSNNDKNYLLDVDKCNWKNKTSIKLIESYLFSQGAIKEIQLCVGK